MEAGNISARMSGIIRLPDAEEVCAVRLHSHLSATPSALWYAKDGWPFCPQVHKPDGDLEGVLRLPLAEFGAGWPVAIVAY